MDRDEWIAEVRARACAMADAAKCASQSVPTLSRALGETEVNVVFALARLTAAGYATSRFRGPNKRITYTWAPGPEESE